MFFRKPTLRTLHRDYAKIQKAIAKYQKDLGEYNNPGQQKKKKDEVVETY